MPSSETSWGHWVMASESLALEDCLDALIDYRGKTPKKINAGIPLVTAKVVKSGRIETPDEFIAKEDYEPWMTRGYPELGDVVLTTEAPLGEVGQIKFLPVALAQRIVTLRGKKGILDNDYLLYLLQTEEMQAQLVGRASGTTVIGIKQSELRKIELQLPPLAEQRGIAEILGALDDRIDNLRQTNATLEAIAAALFKSWFVDFDGVPPEDMQESELGLIPKGWRVASLEEHVDAERGLSYKGAGLAEAGAGVPMHNLNSVLEFGGYKYAGIKYYSGDYKEKHLAVAGDIIVANTEQGHEHRLIGFPAIVPGGYTSGLFSHHLYRVRIKADSPITREWLYHCLMAPSVREQIIGCANGSTVNMLKPDGLKIPRFTLPPHELCETFDAVAAPLRLKAEANVEHMETLATLRDTLLPRLISGQLRLPHADRLAGTVT